MGEVRENRRSVKGRNGHSWDNWLCRHVNTGQGIGWVDFGLIEIEQTGAFGGIVYTPIIRHGLKTELVDCRDLLPSGVVQ